MPKDSAADNREEMTQKMDRVGAAADRVLQSGTKGTSGRKQIGKGSFWGDLMRWQRSTPA